MNQSFVIVNKTDVRGYMWAVEEVEGTTVLDPNSDDPCSSTNAHDP